MTRIKPVTKAALLALEVVTGSASSSGTSYVRNATAAGNGVGRRQCVAAIPDVNETAIISSACNQGLQNDITECANNLTSYIQQSAAVSCTHYHQLYNDCLAASDNAATQCSDSQLGYQDCSNYVLQTYAYCGCYYSVPSAMYQCANVELGNLSKSINIINDLTTSEPATARPTGLASSGASSGSILVPPSAGTTIATPANSALASPLGAASTASPTETGGSTLVVPIPNAVSESNPPSSFEAATSIKTIIAAFLPTSSGDSILLEGTQIETITITTTDVSLVTPCATPSASCHTAYASLSTHTAVHVTALYYSVSTKSMRSSSTADGASYPPSTPLGSSSSSSAPSSSSLADQGGSADGELGTGEEGSEDAPITVSWTKTEYAPTSTGAGSGSRLGSGPSEVENANPSTLTMASQTMPSRQSTLASVPMETGQSNIKACAKCKKKRSILMG